MTPQHPHRTLLSELADALDAGWEPGAMTCERQSRVRFAGRTWSLIRRIGREDEGLEASVYLATDERDRLRADPALPSSGLLAGMERVASRLKSLGYRGGFSFGRMGPGEVNGLFTKALRTAAAIRKERGILETLSLAEPGRRKA